MQFGRAAVLAGRLLAALHSEEVALRVSGAVGRDRVAPAAAPDTYPLTTFRQQVRTHDGAEHVYSGVPVSTILTPAGMPSGEDLAALC